MHLQALAQGLGLSPNASCGELRLVIEGKLAEMGKEPTNVQVVVYAKEEPGPTCLKDDDGVFLEADAYCQEAEGAGGVEEPEDKEEEEARVEKELREAIRQLHATVGSLENLWRIRPRKSMSLVHCQRWDELQRELRKEKARVKSMWRTNCEQLAYYDDELAAKDEEIAKLRGSLGVGKWPGATGDRLGHASSTLY